jgi:hypothetical protein
MAKIVSLLLAIALWFLINGHLNSKVEGRPADTEDTIEL